MRDTLAWRLVEAAAPRPRGDGVFLEGPLPSSLFMELATTAYGRLRSDWRRSRAVVSGAQRSARSKLPSSQRRLLGELLHGLVRYHRTMEVVLQRAGLSEGATGASLNQAFVLGSLVTLLGMSAERAAALRGRPDIDWELVADPVHALRGWLLEEQPSAATAFSVAVSLPDWLGERIFADFGEDSGGLPEAVALGCALNERAPLCLRVNSVLSGREAVLAELAAEGVSARASRFSRQGIVLEGHVDVHSLAALREGRLEVQDEGSQLIVEMVASAPGQVVLDACSGAGGKTLALGAAMAGKGRLLAADVRHKALREAGKRLRRAGLSNVQPVRLSEDGILPKQLEGLIAGVDRVLVDAPCSGTGALRRNPQSRWHLSPLDLDGLPAKQGMILDRFAPLVRSGGLLVYATCSVLRAENEEVSESFLARHPEFSVRPSAELLGEALAEQVGDGRVLRLYPHVHDTDGFYAVAFVRS